jgi:hypothetical protein
MALDLDAHAQTAAEVLIGGLDYSLPNSATYVVDRRTQHWFTSAAGTFRPNGPRTFTITIGGDNAWVDLSTVLLTFGVRNMAPNADFDVGQRRYMLAPKTQGPWGVVSRLRVYVSGSLVEDLQFYNRLHQQFFSLQPRSQRRVEGALGYVVEENDDGSLKMGRIANGDIVNVAFRPLSGLLNSGKLFPVSWCPIRIEVELADGLEAWWRWDDGAQQYFVTDYQIEDPKIVADAVTLDSGMTESFARLLEQGKTLPLNITSFSHHNMAIVGENPVVSLTRACSHIRDVAWSFTRRRDADVGAGYDQVYSIANDFIHPHAGIQYRDGGSQVTDATNYQAMWQLGSKILGVEARYRSTHELLFSTLKSIGMHHGGGELPDLNLDAFRTTSHLPIVSLERALGIPSSGLSSRSGSLLTLQLFDLRRPAFQGVPAENVVDAVWIVIMHEVALSMSKYGTIVAS